MRDFSARQRAIFAQAVVGLVLAAGLCAGLYAWLPVPELGRTLAGRLAYALRWVGVAALAPVTAVQMVALYRLTHAAAVDPLKAEAVPRVLRVLERFLQNTLEQFVVFAAGALAAASHLGPERITLVAAAALVFLACRVAFLVGYLAGDHLRAGGFAAGAVLVVGLVVGSALATLGVF